MSELLVDPGVVEAVGGLIVVALTALTGALGVAVKKLNAVKDQVVNGHGSSGKDDNMRDQIDRIETAVATLAERTAKTEQTVGEGFRRMDKQHGETHKIITQEVEDRQALDKRMTAQCEQLWQQVRRNS